MESRNNLSDVIFLLLFIALVSLASCATNHKFAHEKLIRKRIIATYEVAEQQDNPPAKEYLRETDILYFDMDKKLLEQIKARFEKTENPDSIGSQTAHLKDVYQYNDEGEMTEVKSYMITQPGENYFEQKAYKKYGAQYLYEQCLYQYDNKGNNIESQFYIRQPDIDTDLRFTQRYVSTYNSKGYKTEKVLYDPKANMLFRWQYYYDEKGNLAHEKCYDDKGGFKQIRYTYTEKENVDTQTYSDSVGNIYRTERYIYEYNNDGYWIRRIFYLDEKPVEINEVTIEYYHTDVIRNELWYYFIPVFAHRGPYGIYALYLYDDGSFIEDNIESITSEKFTRKGFYYYLPETGEAFLTYTDGKHKKEKYGYLEEKATVTRPQEVDLNKSDTTMSLPLSYEGFEVVKIRKGEKPKPYKDYFTQWHKRYK